MSKPNIILLHGALGTKDQFNKLNLFLSQAFEVHTLDFNGHGKHKDPVDFSMSGFTTDVINFMDSHSMSEAHFFGYSMGGYVALYTARHNKSRVQSIVTLGTKLKWTPQIAAQETGMLDPDKMASKVPAFANQLADLHGHTRWKKLVQNTGQFMLTLGNGEGLLDSDFGQIDKKVLICIGDQDRMVSIDESQKAADRLQRGECKILAGGRHPLEAADLPELSGIITSFIVC